jgi:aryl-alcohol dehydrogenase-like predicted oxidoreductase
MEKRKLGRSGLSIAPIMFGGNVFGWSADEKTSFALLDAFVDAGFDAIDTADVYSRWADGHVGGESEIIIGKWMKARGSRSRVVIATKLGSDMGDGRKGLKKDYVPRAVEASLKRLQTDYIDLYQTHYDDPDTSPEETLEALADLIRAGKVRAIGASNYTPERLAHSLKASAASNIPRYETLQPPYNLYDREKFERGYQTLCVEEGIGVIPYYSLGAGFLTGKYRSEQDLAKSAARGGKVKNYLNARGFRILKALDETSARHRATPAQISLAWLLTRPAVAAPIASATSVTQLQEILKSTQVKLAADDIRQLDDASSDPTATA